MEVGRELFGEKRVDGFVFALDFSFSLSSLSLAEIWPCRGGRKYVLLFFLPSCLQKSNWHLLHIISCLGGFAKTMYNMVVLLSCFA